MGGEVEFEYHLHPPHLRGSHDALDVVHAVADEGREAYRRSVRDGQAKGRKGVGVVWGGLGLRGRDVDSFSLTL